MSNFQIVTRTRLGIPSLLHKQDDDDGSRETEISNLHSDKQVVPTAKDVPSSKKVSVILRIERSGATPCPPESPLLPTTHPVNKSSTVQFSVMSRSYNQPTVYSSLPQLEEGPKATELTLFNSDVPARFATLSRTKCRSMRSRTPASKKDQGPSIRHSKTFSSFHPVPVPKVTLKTQDKKKESKVEKLKQKFEEPSKL